MFNLNLKLGIVVAVRKYTSVADVLCEVLAFPFCFSAQ
jgi:hypothetical protein